MKRVCIDCGDILKNRSKATKRCRACDILRRNKSARGRIIGVYCKKCGKELSYKKTSSHLCRTCYVKNPFSAWNKGTKGICVAWNKGLKGKQIPWNKNKGTKTPKDKLIKNSNDYKLWREAIYKRDDYTCQKCKKRGNRLHPHHIKNFSSNKELRFIIGNGIALCEQHHKEFHKLFGRKNNNRTQIKKYINA